MKKGDGKDVTVLVPLEAIEAGAEVFRLPENYDLADDEATALNQVAGMWGALEMRLGAVTIEYANFATMTRVYQGMMLKRVQDKFGAAVYADCCNRIGVKKSTANNYKKLYEHKENEFLMSLPPAKVLALITGANADYVEFTETGIRINLGDGVKEITAGQAAECTFEELKGILDGARAAEKKAKWAEQQLKEQSNDYETLLDKEQKEKKELRERLNRIENSEPPEYEKLEQEAAEHLKEVHAIIKRIMTGGEIDHKKKVIIFRILNEMRTLLKIYGEEVNDRYYTVTNMEEVGNEE